MDNTDGSGNNKHLTFSDAKAIARMWEDSPTQTLCHYSESSEHSQNSLGRCSTCFMVRLKTLINVFDIFSSGVPTETTRIMRNILCNRGFNKRQMSTKDTCFRINLALCWEFQHKYANTDKSSQNSQQFAVTGISSTCHVCI